MKKGIGILAALMVIALASSDAQAQGRYGRYGNNVNTPFGRFNMNDMIASGGDPFAAEEAREQKMMMMQQQQMMKTQQQYMQQMAKQKKAQDEYIKKHPEAARPPITHTRPVPRSKKKKSTTHAAAAAKGAKVSEEKAEPAPADLPGAASARAAAKKAK